MLFLALPASAHSRSELDEWVEDWSQQVDEGLSAPLLLELTDMRERHPWYFDPAPAVRQATSSYVSRGMGDNVEQWRDLVSVYWGSDTDQALCIVQHESGGNELAKNPRSSARGLFQILASLWAPHFGVSYEDLYNPEINARLAREIYEQQGWGAWSPYNRGLCH